MPGSKKGADLPQQGAVYTIRKPLFRSAGQLQPVMPVSNSVLYGFQLANKILLVCRLLRQFCQVTDPLKTDARIVQAADFELLMGSKAGGHLRQLRSCFLQRRQW